MRLVQRSVLPGFNITMGFTVAYLSLIVLIPLSSLFIVTSGVSFDEFCAILSNKLVKQAFIVTFRASFIAALINAFFGLIVAWTLVRYQFWGRRLLDALVDVPFALPTAVSGLALARIYSSDATVGWIGPYLPFDVCGTEIGVIVALTFIGTPFVIRTLQPALEEVERELEEAAASLGATRWQTFWRVIFPLILPAQIAGFTMAFARALGEYGSVLFIGRMIPGKTELISNVIMGKLYAENGLVTASAVALAALLVSFALLLLINVAQVWARRRSGRTD